MRSHKSCKRKTRPGVRRGDRKGAGGLRPGTLLINQIRGHLPVLPVCDLQARLADADVLIEHGVVKAVALLDLGLVIVTSETATHLGYLWSNQRKGSR